MVSLHKMNSFDGLLLRLLDNLARSPLIVKGVFLLNMAGFIAWYKYPSLMLNHASTSEANLKSGRYWTIVTSAFSHRSLFHFLMNMQCLVCDGSSHCSIFGPYHFCFTLLVSSLACSVSHIFFSRCLRRIFPCNKRIQEREKTTSLGLSGGLCGLQMELFKYYNAFIPTKRCFGSLFPIRLMTASEYRSFSLLWEVGCTCIDLLVWPTTIGHVGHLGGYLGGYLTSKMWDSMTRLRPRL